MPGVANVRDFAGYRTNNGSTVKWGRLYPCGALATLRASSHTDFLDLKIGLICDLRRDEELADAPAPQFIAEGLVQRSPINPGSTLDI